MASEAQRIYAAMQAVANTEARQRARIAELEAALEPFGVVGRLIDGPFGPGRVDDAATFKSGAAWRDRDGNAKTLTWGHFRRAAAALQKGADHGET